MKISFKTNLPTNKKETLDDIIKIAKYASLELDVNLEITSYGTMKEVNLAALNNVILSEINDELMK